MQKQKLKSDVIGSLIGKNVLVTLPNGKHFKARLIAHEKITEHLNTMVLETLRGRVILRHDNFIMIAPICPFFDVTTENCTFENPHVTPEVCLHLEDDAVLTNPDSCYEIQFYKEMQACQALKKSAISGMVH